jgi:hypothetical protein
MWVDGIDAETGWIDPAIWERLSPSDKERYYELVQNMLAQRKSAHGQPSDGDGAQQDNVQQIGDGAQQDNVQQDGDGAQQDSVQQDDQHDDGATHHGSAQPSVQHDNGDQGSGNRAVAQQYDGQGDDDQTGSGKDQHSDTQHDNGQQAVAEIYPSAQRRHRRMFQAQAVLSDLYTDLSTIEKKIDAQDKMISYLAEKIKNLENQI